MNDVNVRQARVAKVRFLLEMAGDGRIMARCLDEASLSVVGADLGQVRALALVAVREHFGQQRPVAMLVGPLSVKNTAESGAF
jgi:hypothetical protein